MTEPELPGSNPAWLATTARRDGGGWVLDGRKWFTSSADGAAFAVVMAVTDPAAPPHGRATLFVVPTDTPGFTLVRNIPVMGHVSEGWASHGEVELRSARSAARPPKWSNGSRKARNLSRRAPSTTLPDTRPAPVEGEDDVAFEESDAVEPLAEQGLLRAGSAATGPPRGSRRAYAETRDGCLAECKRARPSPRTRATQEPLAPPREARRRRRQGLELGRLGHGATGRATPRSLVRESSRRRRRFKQRWSSLLAPAAGRGRLLMRIYESKWMNTGTREVWSTMTSSARGGSAVRPVAKTQNICWNTAKMTLMTDTDVQYRLSAWDLSELMPEATDAAVAERLAALERAVGVFEAHRPSLRPDMDRAAFRALLTEYEALLELMSVLGGYASLRFSEDTGSREALALKNRVQQALTSAYNRVLFFGLWWKGLDDAGAEALLPAAQENADYRHYLRDLRRLKPYTLEERSEQLINLKDDNGIGAVLTIYSMLTNRLEFRLEVDGESRVLTRDGLMSYAFSPRPELRAAAYQELYRVYGHEATVLGQIYVNRVRDWHEEQVGLRGYSSPIAVRNIDNDVPDKAVEVLLDVVLANAPLFQRYFRMKAGWLGVERLRRYDLYAPLTGSDREIPFPEAVQSVLDTFRDFHPLFAVQAERVFNEGHVDSELRKGKRAGAFCSTVLPRLTPWVLVNYAGKVRDVATLAHELGHAIHSMMAEGHSILTQHSSLPLAETASVFAEMLMTDRLLREVDDPLARRELLAAALDDVYATVLRQACFVRFELAAHRAILEGCSLDHISELYLETLHDQFGDSLELAPEFQHEWLSIPHIYHTPFYCYAYSFGQLLVLALYRRFREQGEAFKPGYLKLLTYGGSARPEEILAETGIDVTDRAFWQGGFDVVQGMIDELEGV